MTIATVSRHVQWVRLQAEHALLTRLNAGFGFADGRSAAELYLRDEGARERLGRGSLRPIDTHREQLGEVERELASLATERAAPTALTAASDRLGLDAAERALLEIAVAFALDSDTRDLILQLGGRRRSGLTLDLCRELATELSPLGVGERLVAVDGRLRRLRALEVVPGESGLSSALIAPSTILLAALDNRLELGAFPLGDITAEMVAGAQVGAPTDAALAELDEKLTRAPKALVILHGPRGTGKHAAAKALADRRGRGLLELDLSAVPGPDRALAVAAALSTATLNGRLLLIAELDEILGADGRTLDRGVARQLEAYESTILASTNQRSMTQLPLATTIHSVELPRPTMAARTEAWAFGLAHLDNFAYGSMTADAAAVDLAARYVIGPGLVGEVVAETARSAHAAGIAPSLDQLEAIIGSKLALRLGSFGTLVPRRARFDEMVLPQEVIDTLRDMIAMVGARSQILEAWGFERHLGLSRGVSALFSGEPGTGKTMAASVVSSELGLELIRIDLSSVISKWVGETEKNLAKIFDEAQSANAMLLFDEADSLFAKRTEVKSAQDRFANLEVNYILQRMETFDGVSVLTTNLENAIDPAFVRRLNFRVRFPAPELDERETLWRQLVPPAAALEGDADFRALAERFEMTGGHIKNAVVRAAVIAAREQRNLRGTDLLAGAHHEYLELGKVMPEFSPKTD